MYHALTFQPDEKMGFAEVENMFKNRHGMDDGKVCASKYVWVFCLQHRKGGQKKDEPRIEVNIWKN